MEAGAAEAVEVVEEAVEEREIGEAGDESLYCASLTGHTPLTNTIRQKMKELCPSCTCRVISM